MRCFPFFLAIVLIGCVQEPSKDFFKDKGSERS